MIYWAELLALTILAYILPGYALLSCVRLRGLGHLGLVLLAVPVSLVLVPFTLALVGSVFPLVPSLWMLAAASLLVLAFGLVRERRGGRGIVNLVARNQRASSPGAWEWLGISAFILIFAALVNLPNIDLLVQGDQSLITGTYDAFLHMAELTSVARSGIPPLHYFFPDVNLSYYYWSWIYPAAIANQAWLRVPLARAYAIHAFVQVMAFLGLCYYLLRLNLSRAFARLSGLAFLTVFGGLGFFVTMKRGTGDHEWWQGSVPWLVSPNRVISFAVDYTWVPQHLAGGMAFVLALLLWRHVRARAEIRWSVLGVLLAFMLGTSPYIFIASCLAIIVWAIHYRKALLRRRTIMFVALALLAFGLGSWRQLSTTLGHGVSLEWNTFRVPFLERYLGIQTSKAVLVDRGLTFFFLPVIASWILLIDVGLPFVLYLLWAFRRGLSRPNAWARFLSVFPALPFILICLVRETGPTDNLAMRAMIPAQITIVVAAAMFLDRVRIDVKGWLGKIAIAYLGLMITAVQAATWMIDLQTATLAPVGAVMGVRQKLLWEGVNLAEPAGFPHPLDYIHWINVNTPRSALVVEGDPLPSDDLRLRLLERMSFISPQSVAGLPNGSRDFELITSADHAKLQSETKGKSVLEQALSSRYVQLRKPEILYVDRQKNVPVAGKVVYHDEYVTIYELTSDGTGS
jgi:hypothetical protein